ncbi:MAG: hypothetical protein Q7P63_02490 [Verrucomicrobiota bacterium JB022]|nr:hypothetical protein [Verrucomicrobiota bacterium JB022]
MMKPFLLLALLAALATQVSASWFGVYKPVKLNADLTSDKVMQSFEAVMKQQGFERIPARPPTTIWEKKGGGANVRVSLAVPPGGTMAMVSLINQSGDDKGDVLSGIEEKLSQSLTDAGGAKLELQRTMN